MVPTLLAASERTQTGPACLQAGFREKSADGHQTFCAIFDLPIKVIDAEFYGMEEVRCVEYLLRLWESGRAITLPEPSVQFQPWTEPPRSPPRLNPTPGTSPPAPLGGDKPQLWLPSSRVHTLAFKTQMQKYI